MATTDTQLITELIESNLPLNWVTLEQFGKLIGLPHQRLYRAKDKWPEGLVWQKIDNKLYFSLKGWDQWVTEQAIKNYQQAYDSLVQASKSTSKSVVKDSKLHSRYLKQQQAQVPLRELELN